MWQWERGQQCHLKQSYTLLNPLTSTDLAQDSIVSQTLYTLSQTADQWYLAYLTRTTHMQFQLLDKAVELLP